MGRLEAPGQGIQNQFVEAQQIDFGGCGKAGGWGGTGQGIQNQFVEPQQIDFAAATTSTTTTPTATAAATNNNNNYYYCCCCSCYHFYYYYYYWYCDFYCHGRLQGLSEPELCEINDPTRPDL